jgi:hypothetical protein
MRLALLLVRAASPPPASAGAFQPPNTFAYERTIRSIDARKGAFKVGKQKIQTNAETRYTVGNSFGSFRDLAPGQRVRVRADGSVAVEMTVMGKRR